MKRFAGNHFKMNYTKGSSTRRLKRNEITKTDSYRVPNLELVNGARFLLAPFSYPIVWNVILALTRASATME